MAYDPVADIVAQLAWKGPTGKVMGHIVLTRQHAQNIIDIINRLRSVEPSSNDAAKT